MKGLPMAAEARAENEACAAVVDEWRSRVVQAGAAQPIVKLLEEVASGIRLRALRARLEDHRRAHEQRPVAEGGA